MKAPGTRRPFPVPRRFCFNGASRGQPRVHSMEENMKRSFPAALLLVLGSLLLLPSLGCGGSPDQSALIASLNATIQDQRVIIASLRHQLDNYRCPECEDCPECPPCEAPRAFVLPSDVKQWLRQNDVDTRDYRDPNTYALELRKDALADGYIMSVALIKEKGCPPGEYLLCQVIMGQSIFVIDPTNDTVEFYRYLP